MAATFVPRSEIGERLARLTSKTAAAGLDGILVFEHVDLYYYTGTFQNGALFVPSSGAPLFFVRRSPERADLESPLAPVIPYVSFKELLAVLKARGHALGRLGIDEASVTLSQFHLLKKNFPESAFADAGALLRKVRAVKSAWEIKKMEKAGEVGRRVTALVPSLLSKGITEWELSLRLFQETARLGESCVSRLAFGTGEFFLGTICFGDTTLYPSAFDGPGGFRGRSPGSPYGGSERALQKGDLVFVDIAYPWQDYVVDKTRLFSFKARPPAEVLEAHAICLEVQAAVARRLTPGAIPSAIYEETFESVVNPKGFEKDFMGYGANQVRFLGHGIGLTVNETPVIARKFDEPLEENMVLAVEPKKGLSGIGLVGIENTFVVRPGGGHSLTMDNDEIVVV